MNNKTKKIILFSIISVVVIGITTAVIIRSRRNKKTRSSLISKKGILVCSHIGTYDGEDKIKAQNQLENIKKLIDNDIDIVEIDVQITKDNVPVLFHDNTLDSKTNGSGKIQDKTWKELSSVKYDSAKNYGISKLEDAINYLKKKNSSTILQLDKADSKEIQKINDLGLFKGVQKNILCKGKSFKKPQSVIDAGIMWMPIIPDKYVGKMNNMSTINEIVSQSKGSQFLEAQFSDSDSLLIDGTLSKELSKINCKLLVVAVGGSQLTNGKSFRGDSKNEWSKMINPMKAGAIMTNYPLKLKSYLKSIE